MNRKWFVPFLIVLAAHKAKNICGLCYESGKTRIPVDNLLILAKFYNISMDYITGAGNIKSEYPKA